MPEEVATGHQIWVHIGSVMVQLSWEFLFFSLPVLFHIHVSYWMQTKEQGRGPGNEANFWAKSDIFGALNISRNKL